MGADLQNKGSVLVEGVLVVFIVVLSVVLNLELFRRVNYEVLLEHAAFIAARDKVMGVGEKKSREKVCKLFNEALGFLGQKICQSMVLMASPGSMGIQDISETLATTKVIKEYSNEKRIQGIVGSAYIRFPQYAKFRWVSPTTGKDELKSHMEITRKCPYPTSSY